MHRLVSFIPAVIVAVIITVISSLYIDAKSERNQLSEALISLKAELEKKDQLIQENINKINKLKNDQILFSQMSQNNIQNEKNFAPENIPSPVFTPPVFTPQISKNTISVNTKISSISKFVPLTEVQKQRLREKFTRELVSDNAETESLEDIIGKENADFYREQRKNTFEKVLQESIEKEILFVSRRLLLDPGQEDNLRRLYLEVEKQIKNNREAVKSDESARISTLEKLVLEEKERNRLLTEGAKSILTPAQYNLYIEHQSGNQDMQIWHE